MEPWTHFVDLIYTALVSLASLFAGNLGFAIAALSFTVRLVLLPLTLWLAYRSLDAQVASRRLDPEILKIRTMYQDDPRRIGQETFSLHQKHGIHTLDSTALVGMLLQMTLFLGVFDAVRRGVSSHGGFLWIKDLIMPDPVLAGICAILTGVSAVISGNMPESQRLLMIVVPATLTLLFLWQISSGIAIYSLSSSLVGVLQSFLVRRRAARMAVC